MIIRDRKKKPAGPTGPDLFTQRLEPAINAAALGDFDTVTLHVGSAFLHYCHCGRWGSFGYNVKMLKGVEGSWYCRKHRPVSNLMEGL